MFQKSNHSVIILNLLVYLKMVNQLTRLIFNINIKGKSAIL